MPLLHAELTDQIINAYYHVYNTLGFGFLEKNYERALAITLQKRGFNAVAQLGIQVSFEGQVIGNYIADLIVNELVLVEIKAADALCSAHEAQVMNYLKATKYEVGLILNFGAEKPEFKRLVFTNDRKKN